jgi:hypothetical protein
VSENEKLQTTSNNSGSSVLTRQLQEFDVFAEYILNSDYKKNFEKVNKDNQKIVEKGDIIACLVLGNELGITPMGSIALGRQLNAKSYFSVIKGRELGLNPITSISKIYNIETANGTILSMAVDIISKCIIDAKVQMDYIRDYEVSPTYITMSGVYVGHKYNISDDKGNIKSDYFLYNSKFHSVDDFKSAMTEGKIIIVEKGFTHVTTLRLIRSDIGLNKLFHYSLQEATDAGLYAGFHSTNVDNAGKAIYVTGRSNWNNHPATMLRNRVTSIAGRIVVADKLQGTYSHDEAQEIADVNTEYELVQD